MESWPYWLTPGGHRAPQTWTKPLAVISYVTSMPISVTWNSPATPGAASPCASAGPAASATQRLSLSGPRPAAQSSCLPPVCSLAPALASAVGALLSAPLLQRPAPSPVLPPGPLGRPLQHPHPSAPHGLARPAPRPHLAASTAPHARGARPPLDKLSAAPAARAPRWCAVRMSRDSTCRATGSACVKQAAAEALVTLTLTQPYHGRQGARACCTSSRKPSQSGYSAARPAAAPTAAATAQAARSCASAGAGSRTPAVASGSAAASAQTWRAARRASGAVVLELLITFHRCAASSAESGRDSAALAQWTRARCSLRAAYALQHLQFRLALSCKAPAMSGSAAARRAHASACVRVLQCL
jgi:hypothetical protein